MLEVTDEMVSAVENADDPRKAVCIILDIIERDYRCVRSCGVELTSDIKCWRPKHSNIWHEGKSSGGSLVTWYGPD